MILVSPSALGFDTGFRLKRSHIVGPYIAYDLLQTKEETCAKFGGDRFGNVGLYKLQTNKQTNKNEKKTISALYIRYITTEVFYTKLSFKC
jgi:hypothetical protein